MMKFVVSICILIAVSYAQVLDSSPLLTFFASDRELDESFAEAVVFDEESQRFFVANSAVPRVDVFEVTDNSEVYPSSIPLAEFGEEVTSVAIHDGLLAISMSNGVEPGVVVFIDVSENQSEILGSVTVGALPDHVVFSRKGNYLLTADEGEPNKALDNDPKGTISVLRLLKKNNNGYTSFNPTRVRSYSIDNIEVVTLDFTAFDDPSTRDDSTRFYGDLLYEGNVFSTDVEPEYIAIADNERRAWVTLQENNAIAEIDLIGLEIVSVTGLGFKNYSEGDNMLDASEDDGGIFIQHWPLLGMYQPDQIYYHKSGGREYLIVANEGDDREFDDFDELVKIEDLVEDGLLDESIFDVEYLNNNIPDLRVSIIDADSDGDGLFDTLYTVGGRSIGVYDVELRAFVWESGSFLERMLADQPDAWLTFNSDDNKPLSFDDRSPKRGMEPEGVVVGILHGIPYAIVGLDKQSGFVVFNIDDPHNPTFEIYRNNRDFTLVWDEDNFDTKFPLDLGPEGMAFLPKGSLHFHENSPVLAVANSVSGTITLHSLTVPNHSSSSSSTSEEEDCET